MNEKITPELLFEFLEGRCGKEEQQRISKQIEESPEMREIVETIRESKLLVENIYQQNSIDVEEGMLLVGKKIRRQRFVRIKAVVMKYAAFLLLPLMIGIAALAIRNADNDHEQQYIEVRAARGSIVHFELPDKTEVWLSSESYVKYPAQFKRNRDIYIEGEGYFDVETDKKHPFRVVTKSGLMTQVYGTGFNVKSFASDNSEEITLERGAVGVTTPQSKKKIMLKPGEILEYNTVNGMATRKTTEVYNKIAWKNGILLFRDAKLKEMFAAIERHFNVQIIIKNKPLSDDIHYRATFNKESLEEILDYMSQLAGMEWKMIESGNLPGSAIGNRIIEIEMH